MVKFFLCVRVIFIVFSDYGKGILERIMVYVRVEILSLLWNQVLIFQLFYLEKFDRGVLGKRFGKANQVRKYFNILIISKIVRKIVFE